MMPMSEGLQPAWMKKKAEKKNLSLQLAWQTQYGQKDFSN